MHFSEGGRFFQKCRFSCITSLLKSIPIAFSRMPKNCAQGLSWAISGPCHKPILHILITLYAPTLMIYLQFLHRLVLLSCVYGQLPGSLVSHRVNSHSDPLCSGMDRQPLHSGPILRAPNITLCCYTDASYPYCPKWSILFVSLLISLWAT